MIINAKALSIDDTELNLFMIERMAEELELSINSYTDPELALSYGIQNEPDIIFVDFMMPKLNGIEFITAYRCINTKTPIIMITADCTEEVKIKALKAGATDFLTKPYNSAEFIARVTNLLNMRKYQKMVELKSKGLEEEIEAATKTIRENNQEILQVLSMLSEYRDFDTEKHAGRVAAYSKAIARFIGLSEKEQTLIFYSSPLHDIGKIGVSDYVLLKKGKYTEEEYFLMQQHTIIGYKILENSKSEYLQAGRWIAISHHERYDGTGYPFGRKGNDIHLYSRIVSVADVFDALLSKRTYKEAWSFEEATQYIKAQSGTQFDPMIVDAFMKNIDELKMIYLSTFSV